MKLWTDRPTTLEPISIQQSIPDQPLPTGHIFYHWGREIEVLSVPTSVGLQQYSVRYEDGKVHAYTSNWRAILDLYEEVK